MTDTAPQSRFNEHGQSIFLRQYALEGERIPEDGFRRVAEWVAQAERKHARGVGHMASADQAEYEWSGRFYDLMASGKFCPGGRVLAGAGTSHGNVLNCFVQGATDNPPGTLAGIMEIAKKLALVTKVGGGNGVNLDDIPAQSFFGRHDYFSDAALSANHPDVEIFIRGLMPPTQNPEAEPVETRLRNFGKIIYGESIPDELQILAKVHGVQVINATREQLTDVFGDRILDVPDDLGGIMDTAAEMIEWVRDGIPPILDLSGMRAKDTPINGSGGKSSGPLSFLVEIFDNHLEWAIRGAEQSGPINTLRYIYSPVLRVVRQGGTRRGAGMATISVTNPHVLDFLTAKDLDREAAEGDISTFNISILIDDAFMQALSAHGDDAMVTIADPVTRQPTTLVLPEKYDGPGKYPVSPEGHPVIWEGRLREHPSDELHTGPHYHTLFAQDLWRMIAEHAHATGEPGLIFVDRINALSALKNLGEKYQIKSTNPLTLAA